MSLYNSAAAVGTCSSMCCEAEVLFRTRNHLIHPLESTDRRVDVKKLRADPRKMVKEYTRSAAGTSHASPSSLRPAPVLLSTTSYLMDLYEREKDTCFDLVYSFTCDRLRSIRQDMIIQSLPPKQVVAILEAMIPFYIDTYYISLTTNTKSFDWKLHSTHLQECLTRWADCVPLVSSEEVAEDIMVSYILYNNSEEMFTPDSICWMKRLSNNYQSIIKQLMSVVSSGNYVRFFKLLSQIPSRMVRRSAVNSIYRMRLHGISTIAVGYKSPPSKIPAATISKWLAFDSIDDLRSVFGHLKLPEGDLVPILPLGAFNIDVLSSDTIRILYRIDNLLLS